MGVILALCVVFLKIDSETFAIPAAFFVCVSALWRKAFAFFQQQLQLYQEDIGNKIMDAEKTMISSQDFLDSVKKTEHDLMKDIQSILKSAQIEAASVLKKAQDEIDRLKEDHRRQIQIQNQVLRQKWQLSMSQDFMVAMQEYISGKDIRLPNSKSVLNSVSKNAVSAISHKKYTIA